MGRPISTRDLTALPDIDGLKRLLQSMATLDAVLCADWEGRYYSFNAAWGPDEQMASMRNGSGDDFFAHFSAAGCWLRGFAHEAPMTPYRVKPEKPWPGVIDAVPAEFAACLEEPAFEAQNVTFCIWRRPGDATWQLGPVEFPPKHADPDGSLELLSPLDGVPGTYRAWALDYYELDDLDLGAVKHIYRGKPLTQEIVDRLDPEASIEDLVEALDEIGYPHELE